MSARVECVVLIKIFRIVSGPFTTVWWTLCGITQKWWSDLKPVSHIIAGNAVYSESSIMCRCCLALCRHHFLAKFHLFAVDVGLMYGRPASNLIAFLTMNFRLVCTKDASLRFDPFFLFDATGNHKALINSLVQSLLLKVYVCSCVNKLWAFMEPEVSFGVHRSSSLNLVLSHVGLVLPR
jgi:hypothetical protein